jgi:uncharacterized protein
MRAVSNTSPLLNLAIIDHLHLLERQFDEVLIPPGVLKELRIGDLLPGTPELRKALDDGWIRVIKIHDPPVVSLLRRTLDLGESEAIALATETKPDYLLMDERDGRRIAESLGLPVTGVLGILLRAKLDGTLPSLQQTLVALETTAGFRIGRSLIRKILAAADEL